MNSRVALYMYRFGVANATGVQRYAQETARALAQTAPNETTVEVWAGRDTGAPRPDDIAVHHPPLPRRLLHLSWAASHAPRLDRFTGPVAVVHVLSPVTPVPTRAPMVVTIHDLLPLHYPEWYDAGPRWSNTRALRYAAEHAVAIVTPSEAVAANVRDDLGVPADRVAVVPEGVDPSFAAGDPAAAERVCRAQGLTPGGYVVAVGEIGPRKNLSVLIEAVAAFPPAHRPVLALVGADGQDARAVHELPARLGVAEQVRFLGRLDDATLVAVLQCARALAHPALFEGFGLTPLEAMKAGTAVVASTAGAVPEVVGEAGILVDPRDVDGWADALRRVMADDEIVATLTAAGSDRADRFTWKASAAALWQLYDRVGAW